MGTSTPPTAAGLPVAGNNDLVFGRYQSIRRIAVGGMGEVFLARQVGVAGFDRLVILKSLLPDLAGQSDFVDQFLDEARVAATLNHPNIVSIYEVGQWNGTYFIAMEYIRGDNLSRLQRAAERAGVRIPIDVATYIVHEAALALDHAHTASNLQGEAQHIVHRDVSPQNIMLRTDGVTKVVDFGIAKAANRVSRTATGLLKGKVQYMAPEQVQGEELDGRADQFALGVVLWELVAGRKLFSGNNDVEVLKKVLKTEVAPLKSVSPDVPDALSTCVDRMLARDRDDRYPSLALAAQELKRVLDIGGIKNAQAHAAAFMGEMLGAEIESKTVDLTPSSANNFVINLARPAAPGTAPTAIVQASNARRARVGIAAGVFSAVALGAGTWFLLQPPANAAPIVVAPPPPVQPALAAPRMSIATLPPGASVQVDGKLIDGKVTPIDSLEVAPDVEHTFTLLLEGHEPLTFTSTLKSGASMDTTKQLVKKKASLKLASEPSGADVRMDGKVVGKTPLEFVLEPDEEHDVRLTFESGKKKLFGALTLTPKPGAAESRSVKLKEGRAPPPVIAQPVSAAAAGDGMLTVKTTPWTKIAIDGKPYGSTPIANIKLSAGKHIVALVNEEAGVNEKRSITIKANEKAKFDWKLK